MQTVYIWSDAATLVQPGESGPLSGLTAQCSDTVGTSVQVGAACPTPCSASAGSPWFPCEAALAGICFPAACRQSVLAHELLQLLLSSHLQVLVGTGPPTNSTSSNTGFQLVSGLSGKYIDR